MTLSFVSIVHLWCTESYPVQTMLARLSLRLTNSFNSIPCANMFLCTSVHACTLFLCVFVPFLTLSKHRFWLCFLIIIRLTRIWFHFYNNHLELGGAHHLAQAYVDTRLVWLAACKQRTPGKNSSIVSLAVRIILKKLACRCASGFVDSLQAVETRVKSFLCPSVHNIARLCSCHEHVRIHALSTSQHIHTNESTAAQRNFDIGSMQTKLLQGFEIFMPNVWIGHNVLPTV